MGNREKSKTDIDTLRTIFPAVFGKTISDFLELLADRRSVWQYFFEATQSMGNGGVRSLTKIESDRLQRPTGGGGSVVYLAAAAESITGRPDPATVAAAALNRCCGPRPSLLLG